MRKIKIDNNGNVNCFGRLKRKIECLECDNCFGINNVSRYVNCKKTSQREKEKDNYLRGK